MNLADELLKYEAEKEERWEDWDDWGDYIVNYDHKQQELPLTCKHQWAPTLLLYSTVWDCKLCGAKKEKVEQGVDNEDVMW